MTEETTTPTTNEGKETPSNNNNSNSNSNSNSNNKRNRNRRRKPAGKKPIDAKDTTTPAKGNDEKPPQDSAAVVNESNAAGAKANANTKAGTRNQRRRNNNRKGNKGNANPAQAPKADVAVAVQNPAPIETVAPAANENSSKVAPAPAKVDPNDPAPTRMRPAMRVQVASPSLDAYPKPIKHDDVILVPGLFGAFDDQSKYTLILEELEELHKQGTKGCEWTDLRGGKFQVVKEPQQSKTVQQVVEKLCSFFQIQSTSAYVRMNHYKDSKAWGPYQHDSAATNASRAKTQNVSVGVMFGASRELGFASQSSDQCVYFPQNNNDCFLFGRDVNIRYQHGINALPESDAGTTGCLLISVCGLATNVVEEEGSPALVRYNKNNNKQQNGNKQAVSKPAVKQQAKNTQPESKPADTKESENNAGAPKKNKRKNQRQRARQNKKAADAGEVKDASGVPAISPAPSHGTKDENEVVDA